MSMPTMMPSPDAHARRSDPVSSHLTLASLGKDTATKSRVLVAAFALEIDGHDMWNDTQLTLKMEQLSGRRHQRNVVARTRDLMTDDGWFEKVGMFDFNGRPLVHCRTTQQARTAP
jgi:hypothetical protein